MRVMSMIFTVLMSACLPLTAWQAALAINGTMPVLQQGKPMHWSPAVHGGTAPYTFHIAAGTLAPGLNLDTATGAISGTPGHIADNRLTVTVTDTANIAKSLALEIKVLAPLSGDVSAVPSRLRIGQEINAELKATGGTPPYTWSLFGEWPEGASFEGNVFRAKFDHAKSMAIQFRLTDQLGWEQIIQHPFEAWEPIPMSPSILFTGPESSKIPPQRFFVNSVPSGQLIALAPTSSTPVNLSRVLVVTPATVTIGLKPEFYAKNSGTQFAGLVVALGVGATGTLDVSWYVHQSLWGFDSPNPPKPAPERQLANYGFAVTTNHLEFIGKPGMASTAREVVLQPNRPGTTYAIVTDQPWLRVNATAGGFPGEATQPEMVTLTVTAEPAGLAAGRYDGLVSYYDETGLLVGQTAVVLRLLAGRAPITVDTKALHFDKGGATRWIHFQNPNPAPVHFALQIDEEHFQASATEGFVPANGEFPVAVTAGTPPGTTSGITPGTAQGTGWLHANLVVAFAEREMDLVTLSLSPAAPACAVAPAHVFFESPGEHQIVHPGGVVTIAAKVRDGCGHLLSGGNLFLVDSRGQPVFLHHRKDQSWHGSWKVDDAATGNHRLEAYWLDGVSGRRASNWIQVAVLP